MYHMTKKDIDQLLDVLYLDLIVDAGEYNLTFPPPLQGGGKEFSSGKRI